METNNMTNEQISAFLDSELSDAHIDVALAALRQGDGRATWDVYHQIGDVLRSDDMAQGIRGDFTARMLARLDEEPPILAPPVRQIEQLQNAQASGGARFAPSFKRYGFPSAVAAAAICAVVLVPQLMKGNRTDTMAPVTIVVPPSQPGMQGATIADAGGAMQQGAQQGTMVRDPRISQYLLAHQRFSPSWNSSAQYARSATYTVTSDSDK
jgi:sigma-E factor negative regulatory protein RseA